MAINTVGLDGPPYVREIIDLYPFHHLQRRHGGGYVASTYPPPPQFFQERTQDTYSMQNRMYQGVRSSSTAATVELSPPELLDESEMRKTLPVTLLHYILQLLESGTQLPFVPVPQDPLHNRTEHSRALWRLPPAERILIAWHLESQIALIRSFVGWDSANVDDRKLLRALMRMYAVPGRSLDEDFVSSLELPVELICWLMKESAEIIQEVRQFIFMRTGNARMDSYIRGAFTELCWYRSVLVCDTKEPEASSTDVSTRESNQLIPIYLFSDGDSTDVRSAVQDALNQLLGKARSEEWRVEQVIRNPVAMINILQGTRVGSDQKNTRSGDAKDENTNDENTNDENTNDENTNDENTNDENTNDENTNDENTNDENTNDENTNDENTNDESTKDMAKDENIDSPGKLQRLLSGLTRGRSSKAK